MNPTPSFIALENLLERNDDTLFLEIWNNLSNVPAGQTCFLPFFVPGVSRSGGVFEVTVMPPPTFFPEVMAKNMNQVVCDLRFVMRNIRIVLLNQIIAAPDLEVPLHFTYLFDPKTLSEKLSNVPLVVFKDLLSTVAESAMHFSRSLFSQETQERLEWIFNGPMRGSALDQLMIIKSLAPVMNYHDPALDPHWNLVRATMIAWLCGSRQALTTYSSWMHSPEAFQACFALCMAIRLQHPREFPGEAFLALLSQGQVIGQDSEGFMYINFDALGANADALLILANDILRGNEDNHWSRSPSW